ncbi:11763_t:CDS:2, partial [Racocetra persica]
CVTYLNNMLNPTGRMARYIMILQGYDFIVKHKPEKQIVNVDALSRIAFDPGGSFAENKTEACPAGDTSGETDFSKIDINTKAYIDTACQASSNTIIAAIKLYIDQNNEAHKDMIAKLNERLDLCFNQI